MGALEVEKKTSLLLVIGFLLQVNHWEDTPLVGVLEPRCGYLYIASRENDSQTG